MQYWKKDKKLLLSTDFDIEECFILLQLQNLENKAIDKEKSKKLNEVYLSLIDLLILVLKEFKWSPLSRVFLDFGKILYEEKPTIITFNYDDFVETALEHASGIRNKFESSLLFPSQINEKDFSQIIKNSQWNWNRILGYNFKFDNIMLYDGAIGPSREKYFNKKIFYSHNKLYSWSILKLHGSLNWWKFLQFSPNTSYSDSKVKEIYQLNKDFISIQERD